jgi:hypothetical protein
MTKENKIDMKKISTIMIMIFLVCFAGSIKAQSIRWGETDPYPNKEFIRKIGDNLYVEPSSTIYSIKFENDKVFELVNGEVERQLGHLSRKDGKVYYFNKDGRMHGYYIPAASRYRCVSVSESNEILKEDEFAILSDGDVFMGLLREAKFKVDPSFPPEVLGFFLLTYFYSN